MRGVLLRSSLDVVDGTAVLSLAGGVDMASVPTLQDALTKAVLDHPGERLAVDLDAVDVLDDVALGVLLGAAGRARRRGGELVVVCSNEWLRAELTVTGFDRAIEVRRTLAD